MLPHEVQATMAKVLFLVFATFVLCFGRARAEQPKANIDISKTYSRY